MKMTLIKVDGTREVLAERDSNPTLDELQKAVGGYIERVCMPETFTAQLWANEEGLLVGLPLNAAASALMASTWLAYTDASNLNSGMMTLVGPVVLVEGATDDDD